MGASRLETQRPLLYLELWREGLHHAGATVEEIRARLEPLGYRLNCETWDATIASTNEQNGHSAIDVLLVPHKDAI